MPDNRSALKIRKDVIAMTEHRYGFETLYLAEKATTERLRALNTELLSALEDLTQWSVAQLTSFRPAGAWKEDGIIKKARAAIAKAKGG